MLWGANQAIWAEGRVCQGRGCSLAYVAGMGFLAWEASCARMRTCWLVLSRQSAVGGVGIYARSPEGGATRLVEGRLRVTSFAGGCGEGRAVMYEFTAGRRRSDHASSHLLTI